MSDLDDIFEQYRDADALRSVPFRPDQFSQLQTDLDGEQYGMVGEIAVPVGREPSPAPASAAPAPQAEENKGFEIGGVPIGDIETALNAPFAGIARGVSRFIGNTAAAFGLVDQAKVDRFFDAADRITTDVQQDNLPAQILGGAGDIVGQFVVPASAGIKLLKAAGASPFVASLVSDSLVGLLGMSPNDEALANMISEDASHPAVVALRNLMATDPDDPEWVNRSRNAAEAFALLGMSEAVVRSLPEIVRQTKQFARTEFGQGLERLSAAGRAADERIAELSRGGTMMANPIAAAADVVVSGAGRVAGALSPSMSEVSPRMVSARYPTAVKRAEDPVSSQLNIGYEAIAADPKLLRRNTDILRAYPGARADAAVDPEEFAAQFINDAKENLIWLHNRVPEATRMRSKLWYDGANKLAKELSGKYGIPDTAVAGVMAALSPQKDWFMNVSLAERTLEVLANKQGFAINGAMLARMEEIFPGEKYAALREAMTGKTLGELKDPTEKAFFVRLHDETFADRTHRIITPEGNRGDVVLTDKGLPSGTGWGSLVEISKAVRAFESEGDRGLMTEILGTKHKVRSFYNNIIEPNSANGDVTIDTHAVAAALMRPLSGQSAEVHHNFGSTPLKVKQPKGWQAAANSSKTGVQGTYGLYAQAYRDAAQELGLLPRELQSITWEAIRGLFDAGFKTPKNTSMVDDLWRSHAQGRLSIDDVRKAVEDAAGGIDAPSWE
jgi:hypothetical protein